MHNILLIAKREYLEQVRGRAFLLSTIGIPLLFGLVVGLLVFSDRGVNADKHLVVASNDAALAADVREALEVDHSSRSVYDLLAPAKPEDRAALIDKVRAKAIDGVLWIAATPGQNPQATYISQTTGDFIVIKNLTSAFNRGLVKDRLAISGVKPGDIEALLKQGKLETSQIDKQGREVKSDARTSFYKGYIMALLLTVTTMIYGLNVARSIIQEKTSRIFEVMLAIARPSDMLAGKLIGVGAVGLSQILIWVLIGAAAAGTALAGPVLNGTLHLRFSLVEGILFPVYFVLGFLFNAALFAGLAATCETEQELQMFTPLAAVPVWLSFSLILIVTNNPDSLLSVAGTLFPVTSPIIVMLRMGSQMPPVWQFAVSIVLLVLSIWGLLWLSSRLYRVGILMYGKRATLPEIIRWLRYS